MAATFTLNGGLAVYRIGAGEPALLFPYPHGSTLRPMAEDKLAALLAGLDRQVITFDPPGDNKRPPPPRAAWLRAVRQVDCASRLGAVNAPMHIGEFTFRFFMVMCHLTPQEHVRLWHVEDGELVGYAMLGEDPSFDWQVLPPIGRYGNLGPMAM